MKDEHHKFNWQGAEICYLGYDELTHFTKSQFLFMLASNRSTCGIKPYIRATCNPDANSWVRSLIAPFIADDGYADLSMQGKTLYFIVDGDEFQFVSKNYLTPDNLPAKSLTYISADIWDNPVLLEANPDYLTSLRSLSFLERERFLGIRGRGGNWNIKPTAGTVFNSAWMQVVPMIVMQAGERAIAFWDFAATATTTSDYTTRVLMVKRGTTIFVVNVIRVKLPPAQSNTLVLNTARTDGVSVPIRWQNEPGAAGVRDSANLMQILAGFDARPVTELRDKVSRALPLSAGFESGAVVLCSGHWNQAFISELESFPGEHDDQVDGASGAYNCLTAIASTIGSLRY